MNNPRLRHIPKRKDLSNTSAPTSFLRSTVDEYAKERQTDSIYVRKQIGAEWIADAPFFNPIRIVEQLEHGTMSAAKACQNGCRLLVQGHHRRVHEYIIATYRIALDLKVDQESLDWLAIEVINGPMSMEHKIRKVEQKRLLYLFIFIFALSGLTTRNRASHYAESLQHFYEESRPAEEVDLLLQRHGQERLRKAATRVGAIKTIHALVEAGKSSSAPSMDDALAAIQDEEPADVIAVEGVTDYDPTELPPEDDASDDHIAEIEDRASNPMDNDRENDKEVSSVAFKGDYRGVADCQRLSHVDQDDLSTDEDLVDIDGVIKELHRHAAKANKLVKAIEKSSCAASEKRRIAKMASDLAAASSALVATLILPD